MLQQVYNKRALYPMKVTAKDAVERGHLKFKKLRQRCRLSRLKTPGKDFSNRTCAGRNA